ncbi:hypothetical protein CHARACLAT_008939 [Characodon lateralis]|uniref:Uncharacterized protein n=1 Tax=Characodon lateralis TaxID=208331 RepID=A0ABU7CME4_9TELE|nr:hypothetical protein [Characodon lateralis]
MEIETESVVQHRTSRLACDERRRMVKWAVHESSTQGRRAFCIHSFNHKMMLFSVKTSEVCWRTLANK